MTPGIKWNATYTCIVSEDERTLDIEGWVNVENNSGTSYKDAKLKVVAGDVKKLGGIGRRNRLAGALLEVADAPGSAGAFNAEVLGDYRVYELKGLTSVRDGQNKKVELLSGRNVPVRKPGKPWPRRDGR